MSFIFDSLRFLVLASVIAASAGELRTAHVQLNFGGSGEPLHIDRMALGQGGLSDEPMWQDRAAEIQALHPHLIRLFIQEYFNLLPAAGRYHFETLDRSVDLILSTGATPLMSIDFKPRVLFPEVNPDLVTPSDWQQWDELVFRLVRHYQDRRAGIRYWEVANEPDIGEDGGCPYHFRPDNYLPYYRHTAAAILRADPAARVGGPALAGAHSAILPALLEGCERSGTPLHFVSWHIYDSDPRRVRGTIEYVRALLAKHPALHPETVLDEWNMSLSDPPADARIQPCFIAETVWQMKDAGLDHSCYYHIRDYPVRLETFLPFMTPDGAAFMARWWNRMPQFDGLFDFANTVRPSYFALKLLSRLTGDRLPLESDDGAVHGFLTRDRTYRLYNLLFWNWSASPVRVALSADGLGRELTARRIVFDAEAASADENARLRRVGAITFKPNAAQAEVTLQPYGIEFWYFEDKAR